MQSSKKDIPFLETSLNQPNSSTSRNFKVFTASAGSGKTFQLTYQYLIIALRKPEENYKTILAITFTNAAVREMKMRILHTVKAFAQLSNVPLEPTEQTMIDMMINEVGWSAQDIEQRAATLYQKILHNYSEFSIKTLDSFSQQIVKSFAFELNLPTNYIVEIEDQEILNTLLGLLLEQVNEGNQAFSQLVNQLMITKLEEGGSLAIKSDIRSSAKIMLKEQSQEALQELSITSIDEITSIHHQLKEQYHKLNNTIKDIHARVYAVLEQHGLTKTDFANKSNSFINAFDKALVENKNKNKDVFNKTFIQSISGEKSWFAKTSPHSDEHIRDDIERLGNQLLEIYPRYVAYKAVVDSFPKFSLLAELFRLYKSYQAKEEKILIGEINHIIAKEIKHQPTPFIYEKLGERYHHVFIDEFQDTSKMQWQNIVPLITENLSSEHQYESMVVGDAKQAIYEFRGGEIKQMPYLPRLLGSEKDSVLAMHEEILKRNYQSIPLEYNYRSCRAIVECNNSLYESILNTPELSELRQFYQNHHQIPVKQEQGFVSVQFIAFEKEKQEDKNKEIILELWENMQDVLARYHYKDIAVICRNHKLLALVAHKLQEEGIPYISKKSHSADDKKHIRLFASVVELLNHAGNQVLQADIVNGLVELQVIDADLHTINKQIASARFKTLTEFDEFIQSLAPFISFAQIQQTSLLAIFEVYLSWLPLQLQACASTAFFRNEIVEFEQQHGIDLHRFVEWWTMNKTELYIHTTENNAISLHTFHSSKGLEYKVVFLPFLLQNQKRGGLSDIWVNNPYPQIGLSTMLLKPDEGLNYGALEYAFKDSKQSDYMNDLNALYVATTRAKEEMYIIEEEPKASKKILLKTVFSFFKDKTSFGKPMKGDKSPIQKEDTLPIVVKGSQPGLVNVVVKNKAKVIWSDDVRDKIDFGEVVHSMLEQISTKDDMSRVLYQSIAMGIIDEKEAESIQAILYDVINHDELQAYFCINQKSIAEQPILTPEGKQYIPDRLLIENDTAKILDFKTGSAHKSHELQLQQYAHLLHEMGYQVVEKKIVYLIPFQLINLA